MLAPAVVSSMNSSDLKYLKSIPPRSLVGYSRLVMFSFGFQQAFQRGIGRSDQVFFTKVCVYLKLLPFFSLFPSA